MKNLMGILSIVGTVLAISACSDSKSKNPLPPSPFEGQWLEAKAVDLYKETNDPKVLCSLLGSKNSGDEIKLRGLLINSSGQRGTGNFNLSTGAFDKSGALQLQIQPDGSIKNAWTCDSCESLTSLDTQYSLMSGKTRLKEQFIVSGAEEQPYVAVEYILASNDLILSLGKEISNCSAEDYDEGLKPGDTVDLDEDIKESFLDTVDGRYSAKLFYEDREVGDETLIFNENQVTDTFVWQIVILEDKDLKQLVKKSDNLVGKKKHISCDGEGTFEIVKVKTRKHIEVPVVYDGSQWSSKPNNKHYMILKGQDFRARSVQINYYTDENKHSQKVDNSLLNEDAIKDACNRSFQSEYRAHVFDSYSSDSIVVNPYHDGEMEFDGLNYKKQN